MSAIEDIIAERVRQDERWGVQRHPLVHIVDQYGVSQRPAAVASARVNLELARSVERWERERMPLGPSWMSILDEEVREAMLEMVLGNRDAAREELVQVAAVCAAAVEAMDEGRA